MEGDREPLDVFFDLAAAVKKKGGGPPAARLAAPPGGFHSARATSASASCSSSRACLRPTRRSARTLTAALRARFGSHPALSAVLAQFPVEGAADPSEVAGRIARWLRFQPGEIYFMPGRGAGRLVEMNPALDVMRLEVGGASACRSRSSRPRRTSCALPEDHFLRRKVEDPTGARGVRGEGALGGACAGC